MLWLDNHAELSGGSLLAGSIVGPALAFPAYSSLSVASPGRPRRKHSIPTNDHEKLYEPRVVVIEGLDPAWTARVSRRTGQVYFIHIESGATQLAVPPGFADATIPSELFAFEGHFLPPIDENSIDQDDIDFEDTSLSPQASQKPEEINPIDAGEREEQDRVMDI